VVKAGNVEAEVEFKLLKLHKAERLTADDVAQTLALYKSLKALGVPVKLTLRDMKVDGDAMWALVAVAVKRSMPSELPAEVMPGVELLKAYNTGSMKLYIFRVEGVHYYFVVKTENEWRTAGGKYVDRLVMIYGEVARAIAEAINAIYREKGVDRKIKVKYKKGAPYIYLTNTDLELLGLKQP